MKRRGFLRLLGAAALAPALPAAATPVAQAVTYNRYTYGLAVFHARTRAHVSARGLAHCLRVSVPQAQAMISEMSASGMVTPVAGAVGGKVRAVSNILRPDTWGLDRAARQGRSADRLARRNARSAAGRFAEPDLGHMIAHLRQIATDYGLPLHPRCRAVNAGNPA